MSNIDKRALRNLATSLDGDDWHAEGNSVYGGAYDVGDNVCYDHIASCESVNGESPHADFIAAANPATVLALLDELEAAEKRITELERNEIREEGNQFLVVRHPGKLPVVKHCAGELEGFLRQLLEHDPMATIDIVTHRYYGVGGQWVQDADEYLQMMAAAAGKGE
ncbi:ead/Ea22-like family protein [Enterobacter cloacae complex sp. 277I4]|uniref:ead/Ea22-like family protein n=1 Tax=Enterobacter cloacae complex sp. 277I4 TaxID=3395873 RepID=UPI0027F033CF|nr:ead/Ea22-like family protein [Enterobacter cloacae]HDT6027736.1 ead/Ea22-like family protein [Enterobacter cloacae subsp. cloacae]HDT6093805.1 ead/Ea22-like family protein [Enterobacter cloacae subsp. cloacae]